MDTETSNTIKQALQEMIAELAPDVRFVAKYGGEVLCPDPDSDKHFVGGIFAYKDHVSLEFSEGADLDDPNQMLEGSGKRRRHLKFTAPDDIDAKQTRSFLGQIL